MKTDKNKVSTVLTYFHHCYNLTPPSRYLSLFSVHKTKPNHTHFHSTLILVQVIMDKLLSFSPLAPIYLCALLLTKEMKKAKISHRF